MAIVLSHPIPGAPLSDAFGWRDAIPGVIGAGLHNGQDYKADAGTLIRAAHGGTVVYNGWDPTGGGWMVRIAGDGSATLYLHMREQSPLVQVGQYVGVGVGVGYVGSSGASTGPHLHFMLEEDGAYVDPVPYIKTAPAKPSPAPPKGDTVIHYHKPYRKSRNIKPKERLYLVNAKGAKENVVGGIGPYTLTAHLYGDGFAPGDILELRYDWYDTKAKKTSPHYLHRVEADKHGMIRENATFQRAVPAGFAVYLSVYAGQANKKTGTVSVLDSDAYLHTA
ncbi:M23 family metallopeptidase [Leucobacter sp. G161]|uniref:M23 family metallopeptidase n=1 Tax=Leucobacter sp. G161 TaxID=663704 RepID=UPI00073CE046|nr:peptidoglycan DD-metalloendopeptidase family protein [Leucobacter sp. G161]KUF05526.1 hypothetical protein AUL38_04010 [Leucobacter sp. G161]